MKRKGTYVLEMTLDTDADLDIGALGTLHFPRGTYCYVGSAMGGLDQRLSRHVSMDKKIRWHIDRLTMVASSVYAHESSPDPIPECHLAHLAEAAGMEPVFPGFGCSDCRCTTHLFRVTGEVLERFLEDSGLTTTYSRR